MGRKLWEVIRHRPWVVFAVCFGLYIAVALALPNIDHRIALSIPVRLVILAVGISTLALAVSLAFYFVDTWTRRNGVRNRTSFWVWMVFETLLGVPFAAVCFAWAGMCLWIVAFR
jgi:hypothetical protein